MKGQIEVSTKLSYEELTQILKQKNKRIKLESVDKDKKQLKVEPIKENTKLDVDNFSDQECTCHLRLEISLKRLSKSTILQKKLLQISFDRFLSN